MFPRHNTAWLCGFRRAERLRAVKGARKYFLRAITRRDWLSKFPEIVIPLREKSRLIAQRIVKILPDTFNADEEITGNYSITKYFS
jgi:hypothetical protein